MCMDWKWTLVQVMIAALAVIGFYGILHEIFESVLRPRPLTTAVVIRDMEDAADLDILLCEARRSPHRRRGEGVVLVISSDLMDGHVGNDGMLKEEYALLAERYEAEVCVTLPIPPTGMCRD